MGTRKKIDRKDRQTNSSTTKTRTRNSTRLNEKNKNVHHDNDDDISESDNDSIISNLLRMSVDELISYVENQLGQDWEVEMGFSPGFVRSMLSGEGASEFKSLLLSNLFPTSGERKQQQKPEQEQEKTQPPRIKTQFIKEESPVTIKYETFYHCTNVGCRQKFIEESDLKLHTAFCRCHDTSDAEQKPELNEITIDETEDTNNINNNKTNDSSQSDNVPPPRRFNLRERKNPVSTRKPESDIESVNNSDDDDDDDDDDEIFKLDGESESEPEQQNEDDVEEEEEADSASDFEPSGPKKRRSYVRNANTTNNKDQNRTNNRNRNQQRRRNRKRKIHTCTTCNPSLTFKDSDEWGQHQISVHGIYPLIKGFKTCLRCEVTFDTQEEREAHEETHADIKPIKCPQCWRRFCRKDNLRKHEASHKRSAMYYYCNYPECKYRCTRPERLRAHYRTNHMKRASNTVSGFEDRQGSDKEEEDGFILLEPGTEAPAEKKQTIVKCPAPGCSNTYGWRRSLVYHMAKNHPKYLPFTCKHCDKKFGLEYYHNLHLERVHTQPARCGLNWSCTFEGCDKEYKCKKSLEVHVRTHVGDLRYVCKHEGCDKKFAGIKNFRQHMRTHEGIKKYKCTECDYQSAHKSGIKYHMGSHHNQKILQCEQCDYSCVFIGALKNHERSKHTDERPFKCTQVPDCKSTFASRDSLRTHVRKYHIGKASAEKTSSNEKSEKQSSQNTYSRKRRPTKSRKEEEENAYLTSSDEEDGNLNLKSGSESESNSGNEEEWKEQQGNDRIAPSKSDNPKSYQCTHPGCSLTFIQGSDLRQHMKTVHAPPTQVTPPTITIRTKKRQQRTQPPSSSASILITPDISLNDNSIENFPVIKSESAEQSDSNLFESQSESGVSDLARLNVIESTIIQCLAEDVKPEQIQIKEEAS